MPMQKRIPFIGCSRKSEKFRADLLLCPFFLVFTIRSPDQHSHFVFRFSIIILSQKNLGRYSKS